MATQSDSHSPPVPTASPPQRGAAKRRFVRGLAALAALVSVAVVAPSTTDANQASWSKTSGSCSSRSGQISYNRLTSQCYTSRSGGADEYLRNSGSDTFDDNYYIGTFIGATANTSEIHSRWTIPVIICRRPYYVTHLAGLNTGERLGTAGFTGGIMSHSKNFCA